jgi:hypothetical protein
MARPSFLDEPENAKKVAEAFVDGLTREKMCEAFGVKDKYTITRWRRDPRVKSHMHRLIEDRVLSVANKVDAQIAQRLQNPDSLSVKDLLDIRREYLGGKHRENIEGKADDATMAEAMEKMNDPKFVAAVTAALEGHDTGYEPVGEAVKPAEVDTLTAKG